MSKIIGITGYMGAGKTYIGKKIQRKLKNSIFLEVDAFRRTLLNNEQYRNELIKELHLSYYFTGIELNKLIYNDEKAMKKYKKILYQFLVNELKTLNYDYILIEWALLVQDHLLDYLDALIVVDANLNTRFKRIQGNGLSDEEIKMRMSLQESTNILRLVKEYQLQNPKFQYFKIVNEKEGAFYEL